MRRISTSRAIAYELADAFAERCRGASKNPESMITVCSEHRLLPQQTLTPILLPLSLAQSRQRRFFNDWNFAGA
jgi:hypothetical protein